MSDNCSGRADAGPPKVAARFSRVFKCVHIDVEWPSKQTTKPAFCCGPLSQVAILFTAKSERALNFWMSRRIGIAAFDAARISICEASCNVTLLFCGQKNSSSKSNRSRARRGRDCRRDADAEAAGATWAVPPSLFSGVGPKDPGCRSVLAGCHRGSRTRTRPHGILGAALGGGKAPPPRWWNALHSSGSNTPCCDVADGVKVEDVDWDTQCATDGTEQCHYRVHLDGKWVDVPAAAVVNEPNRFGPAVVWPVYATDQNGGKYLSFIRCFLAGALS
jgi:hypothetical protein